MNLRLFLFLLLCIVSPSIPSEIILAVGNTGLGKSFTAKLFGFDAQEGSGVESETANVTIYRNKEYIYIDTPGFDDTNVRVDNQNTTLNILFKMQEEKITMVHTIFWFVHTDIRATQSLQKQAEFINSLAMNSKTRNVWDNVIVIFKGMYDQLKKDTIKEAIKKANNGTAMPDKTHILPVYLYEKLDLDSPSRSIANEDLHKYGIYKDNKILKDKYKKIMQEGCHTAHPVQIVFNDATCIKCGIKIDKRLSKRFLCHTKEKFRHDGIEKYTYDTRYRHTGSYTMTSQNRDWETANEITRQLVWIPVLGPLANVITGIGHDVTNGRMEWSCCHDSNSNSRGCVSEPLTKPRYKCCHKDVNEEELPGCKKVCESCGKTWGNTTGCSYHSEHQFINF